MKIKKDIDFHSKIEELVPKIPEPSDIKKSVALTSLAGDNTSLSMSTMMQYINQIGKHVVSKVSFGSAFRELYRLTGQCRSREDDSKQTCNYSHLKKVEFSKN